MIETATLPNGLKPLGMTCTSTDCPSGLHYFRAKADGRRSGLAPSKTLKVPIPARGPCRSCSADLIDWERVTKQDVSDAAHTFEELRKERIRHYFWHAEFDERAVRHARRKGKRGMRSAAATRILRSAGTDNGFDGRQTPMSGNTLYYAQHATATCCRKCVEEWHAIPRGRPLDEDERAYLTELVLRYIDERLPFLTDDGEKLPPLRNQSRSASTGRGDEQTRPH